MKIPNKIRITVISTIVIAGYLLGRILLPDSLYPFTGTIINNSYSILGDGQYIEYCDINNNGKSEMFNYYHLAHSRQPVISMYSADEEYKNIWYPDGVVVDNFDFIFGDYDNNNIKEAYIFTYYNNSLCLYGLNTQVSNKFIINRHSIYHFNKAVDLSKIVIHSGGIHDINNDGYGEVIFSINSRFLSEPHKVFAYDIKHDSLYSSEEIGAQLLGMPILYDINNDGYSEIFISVLTNNKFINTKKDSVIVVLDHTLSPYFKHSIHKDNLSVTSAFPIVTSNNKYICTLNWSLKNNNKNTLLTLYDIDKKTSISKTLDINSFVFDHNRNDWSRLLLFAKNGKIIEYDTKLKKKSIIYYQDHVNQINFIDIDGDKKQEFITVSNNKLTISRKDFSKPIVFDIPGLNIHKVKFSIKKGSQGENYLSVQNGNEHFLIKYSINNNYRLRYLFYFSAIAFLFVMVFIIIKINYKIVEHIKQKNEEFFTMQMELVRSQLDPHFLFNALNSISFSINKDDRKVAYSNLGLFSKFLRESIVSLDDFSRPLAEEIDYVKNYLILEKFRFKERFIYDFTIAPGVTLTTIVPKLILFTFIESALKKGILPGKNNGIIEITIDKYKKDGLYIVVNDNGMHRELGKTKVNYTKNMILMHRIVKYFNNFNNQQINISIKDNGTPNSPAGTRVEITIPPYYDYSL